MDDMGGCAEDDFDIIGTGDGFKLQYFKIVFFDVYYQLFPHLWQFDH